VFVNRTVNDARDFTPEKDAKFTVMRVSGLSQAVVGGARFALCVKCRIHTADADAIKLRLR